MWLLTYPLPIPTSRRPELALPQRSGPECPFWLRLSSAQAQHGHFHELFQDTDSSHLVGQSAKQSHRLDFCDGILPSHSVVTRLYIMHALRTLEPGSSTSLFLSLKPFKNPKFKNFPSGKEKLFHTWKKLATSHISFLCWERLYWCSLLIATF